MQKYILPILTSTLILIIFVTTAMTQDPPEKTKLEKLVKHTTELEFQAALEQYVEKQFFEYGVENLPKEKFLISLMRLVNHELRQKVTNAGLAREKYFNSLSSQLDELRELKIRLRNAGISELNSYINELEARLKLTIKSGILDYKKKQVFEDALQLLYVAEEMIKLDQLRDPRNLSEKISDSKDELMNAFGEVGEVHEVQILETPTVFDLFTEWRTANEYKYNSRLLDVKIVRTNLLKSGSLENVLQMFNQQLKLALNKFNFDEYDQAERLFEDLVQTYRPAGVKDFEDVYLYWAESNFALQRFMRADSIYGKIIQEYPSSIYLADIHSRLIQINYSLDKPDQVYTNYVIFQNIASQQREDYYDIQFITALTYFNQSDFTNAVDILLRFPENNPYYYLAQYQIGIIYTAGQNYDLAIPVFTSLTSSKGVPADIRNRSLYKLALINYERGNYLFALQFAGEIPETYSRYDKVLNVLAWSSFMYRQQQDIPLDAQDFSLSKMYANRLIERYYGSEHRMEAESLLAYINQLQNNSSLALDLYRNVYESKVKRRDILQYLGELDQLERLYNQAKNMEENALRENNPDIYLRASDLSLDLEGKITEMDLAEMSPRGSAASNEIRGILNQLERLSELRQRAKETGNQRAEDKADSMIIRLSSVLEMFPENELKNVPAYNWFDGYPVSRKVAEFEFRQLKHKQLRDNILDEISLLESQIKQARIQIERAKLNADYKEVILLERKVFKLMELRKNHDQLYTQTYNLETGEPYAEFDKWGDFGAFGIIDVNFGQRSRLQNQISEVSNLYNSVSELLSSRREVVEDKLKKIEAEIRFMTMKARLEERQRLRAERERSFRETYFDQRTSEFEEK